MNKIKKMKKILINLSVVLGSIILFFYVCIVFTPKDISSEGGRNYYQGKCFFAEPLKDSLDIIAFGHSSIYSGFSPNKMYMEYGYTSYASGVTMQNIFNINHLLKKAIKVQKPRIAILEVDCLYYESEDKIENTSIIKSPFKYHYRWKYLKFKDFVTFPSFTKNADLTKGYNFSDKVVPVTNGKTYMGNTDAKPRPICKENKKQLKKFIKICKKNNIKVMLMEITNPSSWTYAKHNYISDFASENGLPFLDYNINPEQNGNIDFAKDFRDNGVHLNINGAEKITMAIGAYIKENYSNIMTDKRDNTNYNYWKTAVNKYKDMIKKAINNG